MSQCHGPTFSIVSCRNLDMLTTTLMGNQILKFYIYFSPQLYGFTEPWVRFVFAYGTSLVQNPRLFDHTCCSSHREIPNFHPPEFHRGIGPPVPVSCHLRIPYRITGAYFNLRHAGWGAIQTHSYCSVLSLENPFQRKSHRDTRLDTLALVVTHACATG